MWETVLALLVTAWGIRLTYNFLSRGGYSIRFWTGKEDYRWAVLRAKPEFASKWRWVVFNLLFISLYQMGLIMLITLPAVRSLGGSQVGWVDYLIGGLLLLFWGSSNFSESISLGKYPDYTEYRKKVSRFVPFRF